MTPNQGTPRTAGNQHELGERHRTDSPSGPAAGANPADTLILDSPPPELGENTRLLFSAHPPTLWGTFDMAALAHDRTASSATPNPRMESGLISLGRPAPL